MKTDLRISPPRRQEDFACPPWTAEMEEVAQHSSAWPWQQPRSRREALETVPFPAGVRQ